MKVLTLYSITYSIPFCIAKIKFANSEIGTSGPEKQSISKPKMQRLKLKVLEKEMNGKEYIAFPKFIQDKCNRVIS